MTENSSSEIMIENKVLANTTVSLLPLRFIILHKGESGRFFRPNGAVKVPP